MKQTEQEIRISKIVTPIIEEFDHALVCVKVTSDGSSSDTILQILVEDPATRNLNIDKAVKISREISAVLDVEDPMSGAYRLEVSSPGIDRPLTKLEDYSDYKGFEVKIEIAPPIDGQKRFRGPIQGTEENNVVLETDDGPMSFDFNTIQKSKLVMTDDLIEKSKQWANNRT